MFDFEELFAELSAEGLDGWVADLRRRCEEALQPQRHGSLTGWIEAFRQLPDLRGTGFEVVDGRITVGHKRADGDADGAPSTQITDVLQQLRPWRKGPFEICGTVIDTEWRSDLKWDRLAGEIDLRNCSVLDVGCGNGYYGWRILNAGAQRVIGCDPFLLYVMQHEVVKKHAGGEFPNFVLPLGDDFLHDGLRCFDVAFSMGVLYHRSSPIDHLQALCGSLKPGGRLVLETLVLDEAGTRVLVPEGRYAKMRNVWFIPTAEMLRLWLSRTGYADIRVVDISRTTIGEQRRTDWMTFESLADFLDPNDDRRTIEGYPAPVRAIVVATARP